MFEQHTDIDTPSDDVVVWRYLNLERLLDLLVSSQLYLCRLDRFRDPWEGVFPRSVVEQLRSRHTPEQYKAIITAIEGIRTSLFANCWHESPHESAALWKQYSNASGVAIRTTIGSIKKAIQGNLSYHIGRVRYLDSETDKRIEMPVSALVVPFLKRKSFEYEREVRVLIWDPKKIGPPDPGSTLPDGIELPVRIETLVETLYVSPEAPIWLCDHVAELFRRFSLPNIPVRRSTLWDNHVY